jgi:hypothetical protein
VSGSTNSPFVPGSVIGPGVQPGVDPVGGKGKMVRLCTERFLDGRTKAWLDLLNSGKWAAASDGSNSVLETKVKLFIPSGQPVTCSFGIMISKSSYETAGGFLVSAQTGAISLMNNGYAPANRTATGATVRLNAWNEFTYRCDVSNGEGKRFLTGPDRLLPVADAMSAPGGEHQLFDGQRCQRFGFLRPLTGHGGPQPKPAPRGGNERGSLHRRCRRSRG